MFTRPGRRRWTHYCRWRRVRVGPGEGDAAGRPAGRWWRFHDPAWSAPRPVGLQQVAPAAGGWRLERRACRATGRRAREHAHRPGKPSALPGGTPIEARVTAAALLVEGQRGPGQLWLAMALPSWAATFPSGIVLRGHAGTSPFG